MLRKLTAILAPCLVLAACASSEPHVIQATNDLKEVHLVSGMATQIEMPDGQRVMSVVTGKPDLVTAERSNDVVNLIPKEGSGETNLIVRAMDEYHETKVYQYRITVDQR